MLKNVVGKRILNEKASTISVLISVNHDNQYVTFHLRSCAQLLREPSVREAKYSFCAQKLLRDISAFYQMFKFIRTLIFCLTSY